jgi:hypothetical protein
VGSIRAGAVGWRFALWGCRIRLHLVASVGCGWGWARGGGGAGGGETGGADGHFGPPFWAAVADWGVS